MAVGNKKLIAGIDVGSTTTKIVVLDAEKILTQYDAEKRFSLSHLSHCAQRVYLAPVLELTEEEKKQAFVVRDGVTYLVIGNGQSYINAVHYDADWYPPDESNKSK